MPVAVTACVVDESYNCMPINTFVRGYKLYLTVMVRTPGEEIAICFRREAVEL
jgi:hypothetical protein